MGQFIGPSPLRGRSKKPLKMGQFGPFSRKTGQKFFDRTIGLRHFLRTIVLYHHAKNQNFNELISRKTHNRRTNEHCEVGPKITYFLQQNFKKITKNPFLAKISYFGLTKQVKNTIEKSGSTTF